MKKRILSFVLISMVAFSLVACGSNTSGTNAGNGNTEKDTTTTQNETESETVDIDAWQSMSFVVDNIEVSLPSTRKDYPLNQENPDYGPWKLHIMGNVKPIMVNQDFRGVNKSEFFFVHSSEDVTVYDNSVFNVLSAKLYFPTKETHQADAPIFYINVAYDWSVASAIGKGEEVDAPIIELPNGLKIGDYLQSGCPEIIAAYGEPDEINQTTAEYGNGEEYVYHNEDGTKTFAVYATSSRIIGFRMWIDYTKCDFYANN